MNCKPHTLVYIAKLIPWYSRNGDRGEIDLRGTVFRISTLEPGTPMWLIDGPPLNVPVFRWRPKVWSEVIKVIGLDDEYLRPFGDPDFNETIETTKEVTT